MKGGSESGFILHAPWFVFGKFYEGKMLKCHQIEVCQTKTRTKHYFSTLNADALDWILHELKISSIDFDSWPKSTQTHKM
jgi:hypothetical protein